MKRTWYEIIFGLINKLFIGLLTDIVSASSYTKCVPLNNQKCMTQPSLINLHPNEYSQEFYYYPFSVKLDRYVGSCNTLHDLCNKVWVPNKTEDLNLGVLSMITGVNESKTLAKHLPCQCKSRFDGRKCGTDQWWNNDKCLCESKNVMYVMEIMFGILLHVIVKMQNI